MSTLLAIPMIWNYLERDVINMYWNKDWKPTNEALVSIIIAECWKSYQLKNQSKPFSIHHSCKWYEYSRTHLFRTLIKGNRNWFNIARVLYIRMFIRQIKSKEKWKTVRYIGASLYPVFDIAEFDCIILYKIFSIVNIVQEVFGHSASGSPYCLHNQ